MTPEMVLANSDMIVLGEVVGTGAHWSGVHESMIATDYSIRVERVLWDPQRLHGPVGPGGVFTLSFAGGEIDGKRVWVSDVPTFAVGDHAFFCLSGADTHAISPLTGMTAGVFRVNQMRGAGAVIAPNGAPISRRFFSGADDQPAGFTSDEFAAEILRALPIAKSDPTLMMRVPQPTDARAAHDPEVAPPFSIPCAVVDYSGVLARTDWGDATAPVPDAQAPVGAVPAQPAAPSAQPGHAELLQPDSASDRYSFLWAVPNSPSVFNIPPIYYGSSPWGLQFEYSCSDWNRYATLFYKYTTGQNTFGHQGRNDFAFTNSTDFNSAYGFTLGSSTLGISVMYNSGGGSIQTGQKIYESDVILNTAWSWTDSFTYAYTHDNVAYIRKTAAHELGHCFGREHQFTADPGAGYNSVMNYFPLGGFTAECSKPFVDDAGSIRAAYPSLSNSITDIGVFLFHTGGTGNTSGPCPLYWASHPSSAARGTSFTISGFNIENLGTTTAVVTVDWYLVPNRFSYSGAIYCGRSTYSSLPTFSFYNASANVAVPAGTVAGDYYLAAAVPSDGYDGNRSAWSNDTIRVYAPPPPNDDRANASYFESSAAFDLAGATPTPGSSSVSCSGANVPVQRDVWFLWVSPGAGECKLSTCGSSTDTVLEVFDSNGQQAGCNDDGCGSGYASLARFRAVPGGAYVIRLAGYGSSAGSGLLYADLLSDPASASDFDGDGTVNSADLTLLLLRFGSQVNPYFVGDITGDGWVDTADLTRLLLAFGRDCP